MPSCAPAAANNETDSAQTDIADVLAPAHAGRRRSHQNHEKLNFINLGHAMIDRSRQTSRGCPLQSGPVRNAG